MNPEHPATFGEVQAAGYRHRSVKEEMAFNLARKLKKKEKVFPGIHGYEDTVLPQLIHAILAGQNIAILGEKGQAKSRIMRSLIDLLDPKIPVIYGTEIPESPFRPVTSRGREIMKLGASAPIRWMTPEERYG